MAVATCLTSSFARQRAAPSRELTLSGSERRQLHGFTQYRLTLGHKTAASGHIQIVRAASIEECSPRACCPRKLNGASSAAVAADIIAKLARKNVAEMLPNVAGEKKCSRKRVQLLPGKNVAEIKK